MSNKEFVHLHLHTEYSFLDGMSRVWDTAAKKPGELLERVKEAGQKSCAITDHGSTAGWVRFDKACEKLGIKPIFGVEGYYCNDRKIRGLTDEQKLIAHRGLTTAKDKRTSSKIFESKLQLNRRSHFCTWALNKKGIYEILWSMSKAATEGFYVKPRWDFELIKLMKNCLFSSACMGGLLSWQLIKQLEGKLVENFSIEKIFDEAKKFKKLLGDRFYIEMMAIDMKIQPKVNLVMYKIAKNLDIPLILTNDSHYVRKEDAQVHDILLAINSTRYDKLSDALNSKDRLRYEAQDLYVKTAKEMYNHFKNRNPKIPDKEIVKALWNTGRLADRCNATLFKKKMIMPNIDFPNPKNLPYEKGMKSYLLEIVKDGFKKKIIPFIHKSKLPEYKARLQEELSMIMNQGFTPYFILCNDLMKWSDKELIERGPARGSSCGSLVAYCLDITMVDPIPHKLLFSRFIDPNRSDYPDVDMDFQDDRRRDIVQYFVDKYGKNNVAILGNNMMFKAKMALKDVARLYKVNLAETNKVCKLVIERSGADSRLSFCLSDTLDQHEFAQIYNKKYPNVFKFASKLEGGIKQQGVHAAGVVIADGDIRCYTSLRKDKKQDAFLVTTMDKHDSEDLGLLKMDVLGLNTMSIINACKRLVNKNQGVWINLEDLVRDVTYNGGDNYVYEEFAKANTVGVFQFSSPGLTRLSKQIKIEKFSEISDATALHRPGPIHSGAMANYPAFKFGKGKKTKAEHEIIDKWTKDTYGLIIYQEQVMQIVRELGGFDWAQTNTVRKVMSKSGGAEYFMKTFFPQWKKGCAEHGLDEETAKKAFHRIMSFGSWAFNKSHSVAYAFVSYFCMWFKVHYPIEFATAYLNKTSGGNREENIKKMIKDCERMGIKVREPDVNVGKAEFAIDGNTIVASLSDIKHMGDKAVQTIVENQPYDGLIDFFKRVNNRACNKRSVENLIKSGAFDSFGYNKKVLLENLEELHKHIKKKTEAGYKKAKEMLDECMGLEEFSDQELSELKSSVCPVSVGKHLSEYYNDVVSKFGNHVDITNLADIELDEGAQQGDVKDTKRLDVWVRGVITHVDLKRLSQEVKEVIAEGEEQRYALANLEDDTDFIVMSFKGDIYQRYEQKLHNWIGKVLLVRGSINVGWKKIFVDNVWVMDDIRSYVKNSYKPYNYTFNYLFQHPLNYYFKKYGGILEIRKRYKCVALKSVRKLAKGKTIWSIGIVSDIQTMTAKRGKMAGQDFHWVFFEDDTFQGSFMVFPSDKRFTQMKKDLFELWESKAPFMLRVQRDLKFKCDTQFKQVSIAIDKRIAWKSMIKKPFKFGGKKNGKYK